MNSIVFYIFRQKKTMFFMVYRMVYMHCLSTLSTVICVYYERLQQRRRLWTPWVRQCMYEYIEFNQIFQEKWIRLSQLKPKVKNNFLQFWRKIYNSFNIFSYIKSHQQWLKFMIWIFWKEYNAKREDHCKLL